MSDKQQKEQHTDEEDEQLHLAANDNEDDEDWHSDYTDAASICGVLTEFEKPPSGIPTAPAGPLRAALRDLSLPDFEDPQRQNQAGILELNLLVDLIDRDEYVPPLQDTAREFVLFGARCLYAFFGATWYDLRVDEWNPASYCDRDLFPLAYFKIAYWAQFNLKARWKSRLLRHGQVALVETVMARVMGELQFICSDVRSREASYLERKKQAGATSSGEFAPDGKETRALSEWNESCKVGASAKIVVAAGLVDFLSCERFRSERLERLLVTYLDDGKPPDMHLVRGIQRLTIARTILQKEEFAFLLTEEPLPLVLGGLEGMRSERSPGGVKSIVRPIF